MRIQAFTFIKWVLVWVGQSTKYITVVTQQFYSLKWPLTSYTPYTLLLTFKGFWASRKWFQTILHTQKPGSGNQNQVFNMTRSKITSIWHFGKPLGCIVLNRENRFLSPVDTFFEVTLKPVNQKVFIFT